ncbi:MAG: capsular exopolysaccharide family [Gemmatimonadetes bacterium]|nr:capsular exopolysaccharide family [Gemmatimonadota bacterium]
MSELTRRPTPLPEQREQAERTMVLRSSLTPDAVTAAGEGIPLRDYVSAIRRYLWLVLASGALTVGVAAWRLHGEVPMYTTSTSVRLSDAKQAMAGSMASPSGDGLQGYYTDPVLSQIQLLKSRAVAGAVVDSLGLRLQPVGHAFPYRVLRDVRVPDDLPGGADTLRLAFAAGGVEGRFRGQAARAAYGQPLAVGGLALTVDAGAGTSAAAFTVLRREDAINGVLGGIQARPREMTNVIDIGYVAPDPDLAQRVVNTTAASYRDLNASSARQASHRRRVFVEEQLHSTDSLLVVAQYALSAFRKGVQAFSPREKFTATQAGLSNLQIKRQDLQLELGVYREMAQKLGTDGLHGDQALAALASSPQVVNNGGIVSLYDQFLRYQTAHDSATLGGWGASGRNPDVIRVDSMRRSARNRLTAAVDARVTALQAQVAALDQLMAADAASISGLPDAEAEETRLSRQVETLQKLVDDLLLEKQKARIDEAVEQGQVEIVDQAVVPGGPIGKGMRQKLFFALLVGLMLGAGGALVLDRMNTSITRREDVEGALHVPALGIIPRLAQVEPERRPGLRLPGRRRLPSRRAGHADGDEGALALVTLTDLHSAGSQAYRKLRTHLLFSHGGPRLKTVVVTSAGAGEGKSTLCSNLAVTFAQQHMRVLLVDCDLRRARLHEVFGTPRVPGLPEVLEGRDALADAVRPTAVEGLWLLPAGRLTPNATELLGGAAMQALLDELAGSYDLILIDTPPVMAAADAEVLGVQADAVLMVVRAGQTERQSAQYAVQQLRAIGARVVGAVLNDPDEKVPNYGNSAYYYDYYRDV